MDNYLTTAQAAELLGMDRSAVLRAIRQGRLPATRYGPRVVLVKRDDVDAYRAMPRHAGGRPRGSGASEFVTVATELSHRGAARKRVVIGKALWSRLGQPARVQLFTGGDGHTYLRPCGPGTGYALTVGSGAPRCCVPDTFPLLVGAYALREGGKLVPVTP